MSLACIIKYNYGFASSFECGKVHQKEGIPKRGDDFKRMRDKIFRNSDRNFAYKKGVLKRRNDFKREDL